MFCRSYILPNLHYFQNILTHLVGNLYLRTMDQPCKFSSLVGKNFHAMVQVPIVCLFVLGVELFL